MNEDPVSHVKRINRTWIVRAGLNDAAAAYLERLQSQKDPRLEPSCSIALTVLQSRHLIADPKTLFYPGLFSLAYPEEIVSFLTAHRVTRETVAICQRRAAGNGEEADALSGPLDKDTLSVVVKAITDAIATIYPERFSDG